MPAFWSTIFGNDHPVEVEIGCGTGTFILAAAARWPRTNFFGIERSHSRAAQVQAGIEARAAHNARVIAADAVCVVSTLIPPASVAAYHIYFPDPWWKRRHQRRRLFTPAFATMLDRTLLADGRIHVATDVGDLFALALRTLNACASLAREPASISPRMEHTTFERKSRARGAAILEATFTKYRLPQIRSRVPQA
ncbi:MAG: tRNA (guanosine(46)-N7)-methyltransferase TrmB, partial [Candidatus Binatia bacterium]